ncbi:TPA: valine--pyruvate transaminase [Vibrio parahaemolyticus]
MQFSKFGEKFNQYSGITQLMDDLNDGLRTPGAIMLGGGNPAAIPAMLDYFHQASEEMLASGELVAALTNYDGPQGKDVFVKALAQLFRETYGWDISEKNISLTNGSQSGFFYLFNLFAGQQPDGSHKKVLLPIAPEYIGYGDAGIDEDIFVSYHPEIELLDNGLFKYHVDFEKLTVDDSVAAICASRPTNPTGNVLTDEEVRKLDKLARENNIPLIIDNAYGLPFPNIIFEDVEPFWNENTILCMSLSKLGLPGVRCGIVIASEEITQALTNMNGIISLAPGSVGPALANHIIAKGDLLKLSSEVIKPFYKQKSQRAVELLQQAITDERFRIHKPEGAIFLWLWFDELPITTMELYQRLKARGVLIVPGEYFFIGQKDEWDHAHQCLRMNYVQDDEMMQKGIAIIAEEVEKAYQQVSKANSRIKDTN